MELLIYRLIRLPVISVRYFLHDFVWFTLRYQIYLVIHISIAKYYWQNFAKTLAKLFRKTSIVPLCPSRNF